MHWSALLGVQRWFEAWCLVVGRVAYRRPQCPCSLCCLRGCCNNLWQSGQVFRSWSRVLWFEDGGSLVGLGCSLCFCMHHILVVWWCWCMHCCPGIGVNCRVLWCGIGPLGLERCYTWVAVHWWSCRLVSVVAAVAFVDSGVVRLRLTVWTNSGFCYDP